MHDSLTIRIFEWQGDLHVTVDRLGRVAGRRHAPRSRVWSAHAHVDWEATEQECFNWALLALSLAPATVLDPYRVEDTRRPLEGATGVEDTPPGVLAERVLRDYHQSAAHPPYGQSDAVGVSDGLEPPGVTDPLF